MSKRSIASAAAFLGLIRVKSKFVLVAEPVIFGRSMLLIGWKTSTPYKGWLRNDLVLTEARRALTQHQVS